MKKWTLLIVLCTCLVFAGCPRQNSCYVDTAGIHFTFRVQEKDGQATVTARFTVGNAVGTALTLGDCSDDITVNGVPLQAHTGPLVVYEAVLEPAELYTFEFTRESEGPYISTVEAPPPVTITAPAEGTSVSRAEAFDIAWEDNYELSPGIGLVIGGPCVDGIIRSIGDNGLYTINADELQQNGVDTCDLNISLTRTVNGTMDPGLVGTIAATSVDTTWITSTL